MHLRCVNGPRVFFAWPGFIQFHLLVSVPVPFLCSPAVLFLRQTLHPANASFFPLHRHDYSSAWVVGNLPSIGQGLCVRRCRGPLLFLPTRWIGLCSSLCLVRDFVNCMDVFRIRAPKPDFRRGSVSPSLFLFSVGAPVVPTHTVSDGFGNRL